MSHQVLALKWRPRNFAQVVGQEHVIRALANSLDQQRLHHAFLFTGTRGVGKTSFARILAKCLNCEQGISSTPCETCSTCEEINSGRCLDLIEVDAASRTKVEDTREILDNVQYAPSKARYKIYLIDEVHMLSGHSFNALLKTLEEPPGHVKFLLATTDPQKLPVTVLSRCLQFHLKNMLPEQITTHLQKILEQEQIHFDINALNQLAKAANGSMRDALSILEQAIAYSDNQVTETEVRAMLGTIEQYHISELLTALATKNAQAIIDKSGHLAEQAADFSLVLEDLLSALHQITIYQALGNNTQNDNQFEQSISQLAQQIPEEDVQLYYQIGLHGRRDLPLAPSAKTGFEMTLLRMLSFIPADKPLTQAKPSTSGTNTRVPPAAKPSVAPTVSTKAPEKSQTPAVRQTTQVQPRNAPVAEAHSATAEKPSLQTPSSTISTNVDWNDLLNALNLSGISKVFASHCCLQSFDGKTMHLLLDSAQAPFLNDNQVTRLQEAISKHFNETIKVQVKVTKEQNSPAAQAKQAKNEKQLQAEQHFENDPKVQAIIERFDARIAPGTVRPTIDSEA